MPPSQNIPTPSYLTMSFDLVTIRVGEPDFAVDFPVHREIITAVSPYFHGAFSGGFEEATERTISLTDVTEQTFRIFLQWMYGQLYTSGPSVRVPDLSILGRSANGHNDGGQDGGEEEEDNDIRISQSALLARRTQRGPLSKLFDEEGYQNYLWNGENSGESLYFEDEQWQKNYLMAQMSSLNLYIFADKYSVHQLRDDIITALLGQSNTWHWFPDPSQDLLTKAYNNLSESAKFHRFMIYCAAHCWLAEPDKDLAERMRSLKEWQPIFAFEVSLAQAHIIQKYSKEGEGRYYVFSDCIEDSCYLHEHLVHDKAACRERIQNKAHVFAELIDACSKDGVAMAKE